MKLFAIKDYKIFYDLHVFELSKINILVGTNSSGKSSFINAITQTPYSKRDINTKANKSKSDTRAFTSHKISKFRELNNNYYSLREMKRSDGLINGIFEESIYDKNGNSIPIEHIYQKLNDIKQDLLERNETISTIFDYELSKEEENDWREEANRIVNILKSENLGYKDKNSYLLVLYILSKNIQEYDTNKLQHILYETVLTSSIDDYCNIKKVCKDFRKIQKYAHQIDNHPNIIPREIFDKIDRSTIEKYCQLTVHQTNFFKIDKKSDPRVSLNKILNKLNGDEIFSILNIYQDIIEKYIKIFEIGDSFEIEETNINSQTMFNFYIIKGNKKLELFQNFGFGIQNLIPILLSILDNHYICLEEPEANLHPALQSKLAEFIAECATKHNKQFVIETHSEYFIRKLQYLVAKNQNKNTTRGINLKSSDVNITYFNKPNLANYANEPYYNIKIREDGSLSRSFGKGFYDVADNIALDLFFINNN